MSRIMSLSKIGKTCTGSVESFLTSSPAAMSLRELLDELCVMVSSRSSSGLSEKGSKSSKDHLCPVLICERHARKAGVGVNEAVGPSRGKTAGGKATLGKCSELEKGPAVPGSWGATAVGQIAEDQTDAGWDEGACGVGKLCGEQPNQQYSTVKSFPNPLAKRRDPLWGSMVV
ncbi:hypothetical protein L1887_62849 [Cichorium endivia]|nr:hypothetical protein L1887_62849 [Cichorium endivia]